MKHENQDENAIFERKFKEIQGPLEDFFTRVGLLLAYVRGKETMMKRYENFPEVQPIVSKSYDEFIAEAKKMFARPQMTAKEFEKWLQKEAEQLTAKHDQIPAQLVGEAAAAQIEQAPDALLMPMENINEEDQYILSWYFELINSVLDNFSDEAGLEINQLVQASVTKVRGVLANERLTEQRKRVQIYSIKQGLLNKVGAVLEKSDIKYAEIIEQALFVVVMQVNGTPAEKHIGKFVTEQLDQLAQWQESTKAMSVAKRKKSFDAFSNKFVDAVNEFGQQFGLTLLNSEESN